MAPDRFRMHRHSAARGCLSLFGLLACVSCTAMDGAPPAPARKSAAVAALVCPPRPANTTGPAGPFTRAWNCVFTGQAVLYPGPSHINFGSLSGYGCFCGAGSTGLNTRPVDAYDACCRQHDIDWTAICQNIPDPANPALGCDCYTNLPSPTGCTHNTPTFPANLNPCQQACADELVKQFSCYGRAYVDSNYQTPDRGAYGNQCAWNPTAPFDAPQPAYCQPSTAPISSSFGPVNAGDNVYGSCTCHVDRQDCVGDKALAVCARDAATCQRMGGVPDQDCATGGPCSATHDVTATCQMRPWFDPCPKAVPDMSPVIVPDMSPVIVPDMSPVIVPDMSPVIVPDMGGVSDRAPLAVE